MAKIKRKAAKPPAGGEHDGPQPARTRRTVRKPVPGGDHPHAPEHHVKRLDVTLQARHWTWLENKAKAMGWTVERLLEKLVREAYAADPYKAGFAAGGTFTDEELAAIQSE